MACNSKAEPAFGFPHRVAQECRPFVLGHQAAGCEDRRAGDFSILVEVDLVAVEWLFEDAVLSVGENGSVGDGKVSYGRWL